MFDDLLAKQTFVDLLKKDGVTDEGKVLEEWKKVEAYFAAFLVGNILASLSEEDRNKIIDGYNLSSSEDVKLVLDKVEYWVKGNSEKLDWKATLESSMKQAYSKYMEGRNG